MERDKERIGKETEEKEGRERERDEVREGRMREKHDGRPYCHKPCYAALFGPKGVNIGGAGSYIYEAPANNNSTNVDSAPKTEERKVFAPKAPSKAGSITTFSGEANLCPKCNKKVYFAEKVTSLGKDWHRPCLRCERCSKTLAQEATQSTTGCPTATSPATPSCWAQRREHWWRGKLRLRKGAQCSDRTLRSQPSSNPAPLILLQPKTVSFYPRINHRTSLKVWNCCSFNLAHNKSKQLQHLLLANTIYSSAQLGTHKKEELGRPQQHTDLYQSDSSKKEPLLHRQGVMQEETQSRQDVLLGVRLMMQHGLKFSQKNHRTAQDRVGLLDDLVQPLPVLSVTLSLQQITPARKYRLMLHRVIDGPLE
ncbi:hypothetical protein WMY93_017764 [Mugilogobius chulae]|uniref:LIM zinc-binding domain-containing protein n=1 Tax=Mugilogobius chulae TaxID=88201 RepID=A0AAW0NZI1_9GOBI